MASADQSLQQRSARHPGMTGNVAGISNKNSLPYGEGWQELGVSRSTRVAAKGLGEVLQKIAAVLKFGLRLLTFSLS